MDTATVIAGVLAVAMATVAARLHRELPRAYWLAVVLNGLIFMVPVPILVYCLVPNHMSVVSPPSEPQTKVVAMKVLSGYMLVFGMLVSVFIGWLMRSPMAKRAGHAKLNRRR